ncbi:MAG: uroporphyrinogen-III C-methyltransferase [Pseudohongiella sp.]
MSETDKPLVNDDPFQNRKKIDTATVLDEIGRKNHAAPKRGSTGAKLAIGMLFLLVLALAGATGWLGYQQWLSQDRYSRVVADVQEENARLQQVMADMRTDLEAERDALQADLTEQAALLRVSNDALQDALAEVDTQEQSDQQRMNRLQQQVSRDLSDVEALVGALQRQVGNLQQRDTRWLNAEANYLMRLAQQKLQLESDIDSAALLLRTIDSLLADQSGLLVETARQNLADDLRSLQAVSLPDRAALSQQLVMLGDSLDQLSVAGSRQESYQEQVQTQWQHTPDAAAKDSWMDAGLALLRSIFVWREWEETPSEMLPPQQESILKQQLQLKLEQAQLAMLQGDQLLYRQILAQAIMNLQRYFESDSERSRQLIAEIEALQSIEFQVALPDLSATAELIRQLASASSPDVSERALD